MVFLHRKEWISVVFVLGLAAFTLSGKCQRTLSPQAMKAIEMFEQKQFDLSVDLFRKLMNRYPGDPLYVYYYAANLIELNKEIDVAVELLKNSLRQMPSAEGYYYLGIACYRQFKWEEARHAFAEARRLANARSVMGKEIFYVETALNQRISRINEPIPCQGRGVLSFPFDSMSIRLRNLPQLFGYQINYQQRVCEGFVIVKDERDTASVKYFSAPGKHGSLDIFYQTRDKKTGLMRVEELGNEINTEADEILPVYDPVHRILYFASNRSDGLGGFDLYSCKVDPSGRLVGPVQPLPFPINSPWNDYFFSPMDSVNAYLVSDRACTLSEVVLYSIVLNTIASKSFDNGNPIDRCFFRNAFTTVAGSVSLPAKSVKKSTTTVSLQNNERMVQITKALNMQKSIDSLQIINLTLRERLDAMPNDEYRKALYAQWKKTENEIKSRQNEVNTLYALVVQDKLSKSIDTIVIRQNRINNFSLGNQSIYSAKNPIPEQLNFPSGVIYTIQLGVFSKKVDPAFFGGIQPIVAEFLNDNKLIKYYAGVFSEYAMADSSLQVVKKAGFKEAFIVAYYDNKKIPLSRAQELEKAGDR